VQEKKLSGWLRIGGSVVLTAMAAALFYAAYISIANYAGISV
jgi:hypothetical protein